MTPVIAAKATEPVEPSLLDRYRAAHRQWQAVRRMRGLPHDAWALASLQQQHLGRTGGAEKMTAAEINRMIEAFSAVAERARPAEPRKDQDDSPTHKTWLLERCFASCDRRFDLARENSLAHRSQQARYIDGAARKLFQRPAAALEETELRHLLMALEARTARLCAAAFRDESARLAHLHRGALRREHLSPCCIASVRHAARQAAA